MTPQGDELAAVITKAATYVWWRHKALYRHYVTKEDAIQEAFVDCLKALPQFKPELASLGTFMAWRSRGSMAALVAYGRRGKRMGTTVSMDAKRVSTDAERGEPSTLGESMESKGPSPVSSAVISEEAARATAALDKLTPRQKEAIQRVHGLGTAQRDLRGAAADMGVSHQRVHQLVSSGVKRMRKLMSRCETA